MNKTTLAEIESTISGEVMVQEEVREFYSLDASAYQIVPDVVVAPVGYDDVINVIKIAQKTTTPVTPRGAGTGLVGGALNTGIVLDMKNFDTVNVDGDVAIAGAGVRKGALDMVVRRHGKIFAPNPSVGAFCSVGGMVGNNSAGSNSVKYGSMIDNVSKITFVDGTGKIVTLPDDKHVGSEILKIVSSANLKIFPQVTKNSSGYRLDRINSIDQTHKLLVGSEGTLGVILSAELSLIDEPTHKRLFVVEYDSITTAMSDCIRIVKTGPSALEFIDSHVIEQLDADLDKGIKCVLLVEYDDENVSGDAAIYDAFTGKIIADLNNDADMDWWWDHRNAALHHSMNAVPPRMRTPHMIDDATVPIERINDLFSILDGITGQYKTHVITFGHAGNGNIHARLILDNKNVDAIKKIARYFCDEINKLGGTITGEHGDGFASSEFLSSQYGLQNYNAFKDIKRMFDPYGILNPGKKITDKSTIVENLSSTRTFQGGKQALASATMEIG